MPTRAIPSEQYHFNVGEIRAGEWISSAPTTATLGARVGFPRDMPPSDAQERVREAVAGIDPAAELRFVGFRAEGYRVPDDDPFAIAVARAHRTTHGDDPSMTSGSATNDARFYVRRGIPAVCYGPRGRNLHAVDESVELSSIVAGARTLTRLIPRWLHGGRGMTDITLAGAGRRRVDARARPPAERGRARRRPARDRDRARRVHHGSAPALGARARRAARRQPRERARGAAPPRGGRIRRDPAWPTRRRVRAGVVGPGVRDARAAHARRPTGRRSRSCSTCAA